MEMSSMSLWTILLRRMKTQTMNCLLECLLQQQAIHSWPDHSRQMQDKDKRRRNSRLKTRRKSYPTASLPTWSHRHTNRNTWLQAVAKFLKNRRDQQLTWVIRNLRSFKPQFSREPPVLWIDHHLQATQIRKSWGELLVSWPPAPNVILFLLRIAYGCL